MSETTQSLSQFIDFQLLGNNFALSVEKIIEVLRMVTVTPLPKALNRLSDVIKLPGHVILVMGLRTLLKTILSQRRSLMNSYQ